MARTSLAFLIVLACVMTGFLPLGASIDPMYSSFYTALQADKTHHNLILQAVASDDATMSMLQVPLNVTALVPTDVAFIQAALKYNMGTNLLKNTCLIKAILKYHIIVPGLTSTSLSSLPAPSTKNTLLVRNVTTPSGKKAHITKTLAFTPEASTIRVIAGATNATLTAPSDVLAGRGVMHNINAVLLPTTNMTLLQQLTGCTLA